MPSSVTGRAIVWRRGPLRGDHHGVPVVVGWRSGADVAGLRPGTLLRFRQPLERSE